MWLIRGPHTPQRSNGQCICRLSTRSNRADVSEVKWESGIVVGRWSKRETRDEAAAHMSRQLEDGDGSSRPVALPPPPRAGWSIIITVRPPPPSTPLDLDHHPPPHLNTPPPPPPPPLLRHHPHLTHHPHQSTYLFLVLTTKPTADAAPPILRRNHSLHIIHHGPLIENACRRSRNGWRRWCSSAGKKLVN